MINTFMGFCLSSIHVLLVTLCCCIISSSPLGNAGTPRLMFTARRSERSYRERELWRVFYATIGKDGCLSRLRYALWARHHGVNCFSIAQSQKSLALLYGSGKKHTQILAIASPKRECHWKQNIRNSDCKMLKRSGECVLKVNSKRAVQKLFQPYSKCSCLCHKPIHPQGAQNHNSIVEAKL